MKTPRFPWLPISCLFGFGIVSSSLPPTRATAAEAPPPFHYVARLGLVDGRHTAENGRQFSEMLGMSRSGFSIGVSELFVAPDDIPPRFERRAQSAWVANRDGATQRVGLYGGPHTRDDGRQESFPILVNEQGVSAGVSLRFNGHADAGRSAWLAAPSGDTERVGFYDAAHTGSDGMQISVPVDLSNANKLVGVSFNPDNAHATGWILNAAGQTTAIGLTDDAHTAPNGIRASFPVAINDAGYVVGNSDYFAADDLFPGATSWLRRPDGSVRLIGFQNGIHRAPNGQHLGRVEHLTESGFMAGWSTRYGTEHNDGIGQTVWVTHIDGPNRPVGFYDGVHRGSNDVAHTDLVDVNENGDAIGASYQYSGANPHEFDQAGSTAWISSADGTTVRVGLYDDEHTAGGRQFNDVMLLSESGNVTGFAVRYTPTGDFNGFDAWVANGAGEVTPLGMNNAVHTGVQGYRSNHAGLLTESGYVAGYSERYFGGSEPRGQTAWIYNRNTATYVRFAFSVRASDGHAESTITRLHEDGSAIGYFRLFSASGADLGERAFVYVPGQGKFVLEEELDVDPATAGWANLGRAEFLDTVGLVGGIGARTTANGQGVFLIDTTGAAPVGRAVRLRLRVGCADARLQIGR